MKWKKDCKKKQEVRAQVFGLSREFKHALYVGGERSSGKAKGKNYCGL